MVQPGSLVVACRRMHRVEDRSPGNQRTPPLPLSSSAAVAAVAAAAAVVVAAVVAAAPVVGVVVGRGGELGLVALLLALGRVCALPNLLPVLLNFAVFALALGLALALGFCSLWVPLPA